MMNENLSMNCKTHSLSLLLLLLLCFSSPEAATAMTSSDQAGLSDQVVDQLSESDLYNNKRAWQSLQSSWGKRADDALDDERLDDGIYVTGHFVPLVITDGANTLDWNAFERLASGNQELSSQQQQLQQQQTSEENNVPADSENGIEKRAWKTLNVAWGKRRQAQGWNKFRGAWGKREPSWNNLKGMWGKRDQWQKLHGGWGKRAALMN